jgi:GDPmannose 4,6-dehydratase
MDTAIIFGITGQDGSHLADLLLQKNYKVIGVKRRSSTNNNQRINHILSHPNFVVKEADITDYSSIISILKDNEHVDEVYNLAAQSHVGLSFSQPATTWDITGKGCLNILQAIVDLNMFGVRFYQASSSEMFGSSYNTDINGEKYQDENTKLMPNSPYAISKCAAHYSVRLYRDAYKLHASSGILFNHEGPRRGDNFVTQKIVKWISNFVSWLNSNDQLSGKITTTEDDIIISNNRFPKLRLGNLNAFRDWGYAGDYVEAMWLMLQQENPDDYVICTGETHTIAEFLDIAFNYVGLTEWRQFVKIDSEFFRPSEVDFLRGKCDKAKEKLGWKPSYNLTMLISLMIDNALNEKLSNNARYI